MELRVSLQALLTLSPFAKSAILIHLDSASNLSCVLYDDQINGLTAAFSINTANWPYSKVLKNHFFSVQNSDKHVSSKTGDNFIYLQTLTAFFVKRAVCAASALFSQHKLFQLVTRSSLRQDTCVIRDKNMKKEIYCRNQKTLSTSRLSLFAIIHSRRPQE